MTRQIETRITGLKLMECFSQEKDELVFGFAAARGKKKNYKEFFLKAVVFPDFSCLYFTDQFERAKKNSVDLFNQLMDLEVLSVRQFLNERCFAINFEQGFSVVFKLYGNRANIILFQNDEVIDLFHSKIVADKNLRISTLDRFIDQSYEAFVAHNQDYHKLFPTFGKIVNAYLEQEESITWQKIRDTIDKLENPIYYIIRWEHQLHLSLLPIGEVLQEFQQPIEAINAFYILYNKVSTLDKEKAVVLRKLTKEKKQTDMYLKDAYQRLEAVDSTIKNEEIGHILMANLHQIPERAEKVELFDFYRDKDIIIKLKPELSPQKNAENFYRKAKNEKIEIEKIMENIENREELLKNLNLHIEKIEQAEHLKALRNYLKANKLVSNASQAVSYKDLFKRFEVEGFEILVGRNAKNNDLLTQQYAYKEDLWLHARDAQGSHVVVKYKAGKKIPNTVKESAASLAAYYSKRRNETLAPVILTQKKFVRKTKDLAEGQVIVEKEEVVMVEPKIPKE
ncbi:NFACT RNA binding domain-containing protein [Emticicia agri]|uniref:NFACT RNA binding domain-containing protein n=1 Tax=Emticicia agri TaxID=2492393 RepID=UPI00286D92E6|nr:NFACT RNA binding domain-containing protein [Emticicia agri]